MELKKVPDVCTEIIIELILKCPKFLGTFEIAIQFVEVISICLFIGKTG